jgi:Leucine-rich repeat (LRR) protein
MDYQESDGVKFAVQLDGSRFVLLEGPPNKIVRDYLLSSPECSVLVRAKNNSLCEIVPDEIVEKIVALYVQIDLDQNAAELIGRMGRLRWLLLGENPVELDFRKLPELEELRADWHSKWAASIAASSLKTLAISKFPGSFKDLEIFSKMQRLEQLEFVQCQIESLSGVQEIPNLRVLRVSYAPKLRDISALNSAKVRLETVELGNCTKINSYEPLGQVKSLRRLILTKCSHIPSLQIFSRLEELKIITFVHTTVLDKNMRLLLHFPSLEYAGFLDCRGYNMTYKDVVGELKLRTKN